MKILYISTGLDPDYQCDMLFHGLRTLYGDDVVDVPRAYGMYSDMFANGMFESAELAGRWYTVYGLLPDDSGVDRTDIPSKIKNGYFDYVIYGSVHRCLHFLKEVTEVYPSKRVAYIDGEDHWDIAPVNGGIYFKRENADPNVESIQFAIPKEKIRGSLEKTHVMAPCDSRNRSTYVYNTEKEYYDQYGHSYFGFTERRGGWDRVRHYEILAAGAIPYFDGLAHCPPQTMPWLPKWELIAARELFDRWDYSRVPEWEDKYRKLRKVLVNDLTTEALAKRVIERMAK